MGKVYVLWPNGLLLDHPAQIMLPITDPIVVPERWKSSLTLQLHIFQSAGAGKPARWFSPYQAPPSPALLNVSVTSLVTLGVLAVPIKTVVAVQPFDSGDSSPGLIVFIVVCACLAAAFFVFFFIRRIITPPIAIAPPFIPPVPLPKPAPRARPVPAAPENEARTREKEDEARARDSLFGTARHTAVEPDSTGWSGLRCGQPSTLHPSTLHP